MSRKLALLKPGEILIEGSALTQQDTLDNVVAEFLAGLNPATQERYRQRIHTFLEWARYGQVEHTAWSKALVGGFVEHLAGQGMSASTVNGYLAAIRGLLRLAADMELIPDGLARRISSIKGAPMRGVRIGNWLSREEAQALLDAPDLTTTKGLRDRAILAIMLYVGLRRAELVSLTFDHLQQRDGHCIIVNLIGKRGKSRSLKLPAQVKRQVDRWAAASGRCEGWLFCSMGKGDKITQHQLTDAGIYSLVVEYGKLIGRPEIRPHDLRRSQGRLAREGGASLEQISLNYGHDSLETTQRYLGLELDFDNAAPDAVGTLLRLNGEDVVPPQPGLPMDVR